MGCGQKVDDLQRMKELLLLAGIGSSSLSFVWLSVLLGQVYRRRLLFFIGFISTYEHQRAQPPIRILRESETSFCSVRLADWLRECCYAVDSALSMMLCCCCCCYYSCLMDVLLLVLVALMIRWWLLIYYSIVLWDGGERKEDVPIHLTPSKDRTECDDRGSSWKDRQSKWKWMRIEKR